MSEKRVCHVFEFTLNLVVIGTLKIAVVTLHNVPSKQVVWKIN